MTAYANLEEFYAADERRRRSGEADYGLYWVQDGQRWPRWRVSYIKATGEVYGVELPHGRVEVLGVVPPDDGRIYYRTLDKLLAGWADHWDMPLSWVRERLRP
ncbi:MAG: hypothetical protein Q8R28_11455 [Dehalococcoidia bacterium]|nr:hypothetical protein [Dehalococcoidia bacterium]